MSNKLFPTGKSVTLTTADKLNVADASDKDQIKTITIQELMDFMQVTTTSTTSTSTSTSTSISTSTSTSTSTTSSSSSTSTS
jgi:hypothetical protein